MKCESKRVEIILPAKIFFFRNCLEHFARIRSIKKPYTIWAEEIPKWLQQNKMWCVIKSKEGFIGWGSSELLFLLLTSCSISTWNCFWSCRVYFVIVYDDIMLLTSFKKRYANLCKKGNCDGSSIGPSCQCVQIWVTCNILKLLRCV